MAERGTSDGENKARRRIGKTSPPQPTSSACRSPCGACRSRSSPSGGHPRAAVCPVGAHPRRPRRASQLCAEPDGRLAGAPPCPARDRRGPGGVAARRHHRRRHLHPHRRSRRHRRQRTGSRAPHPRARHLPSAAGGTALEPDAGGGQRNRENGGRPRPRPTTEDRAEARSSAWRSCSPDSERRTISGSAAWGCSDSSASSQ